MMLPFFRYIVSALATGAANATIRGSMVITLRMVPSAISESPGGNYNRIIFEGKRTWKGEFRDFRSSQRGGGRFLCAQTNLSRRTYPVAASNFTYRIRRYPRAGGRPCSFQDASRPPRDGLLHQARAPRAQTRFNEHQPMAGSNGSVKR